MGSQLAAAQLLSDNLSKQIATLNIESPSSKRQSITKELFDTIGITYDASFSSPNVNKIPETSSKKLLLSADSFSSKDTSRRKQRSGAKISETETGRRRRDSLDRVLCFLEPLFSFFLPVFHMELCCQFKIRSIFFISKINLD